MLLLSPSCPRREEIIAAMKAICKQPGWKGYDLDDTKSWSKIVLGRSLQSFLSEEDHIAAIQKFFLKSLDELSEIKSQYNYLPWDSSNVTRDISDDPNSNSITSIE